MGDEAERVAVQTYVPAYQKKYWAEDADQMGVSQSEFVRMMVQAGRSDLDLSSSDEATGSSTETDQTSPAQNGGDIFRERVLETLSAEKPQDWDELVDALTKKLKEELDRTLEELQQDNVVRYSGRQGGYLIREDHDE